MQTKTEFKKQGITVSFLKRLVPMFNLILCLKPPLHKADGALVAIPKNPKIKTSLYYGLL